MIVVDTNIIAYLFLNGDYTQEAEALIDYDPVWTAPFLWRSEFRNILALYLRKKIISYSDSLAIMQNAEELMKGNEYAIKSDDVLELVKNSNCSAYDCEFVCLANELSIYLITEDKVILKEFPKIAVSLKKLLILTET